ncbi:hypothetical protein CYLTODRAFT_401531 [Cylindrobasidium torrendii FP15055 ss-10]|uniref:CBS domain-containing protein n=1 Tax=Cylindrobasidium torrendii FP15055 ss-10 TaxID=1314674 RepID=A0A0D7B3G5_9AGAR|nr:hypothetical protein CYLTODRAFT_401531 [Cylindrobasidium torrendii FP15055 ss-10]
MSHGRRMSESGYLSPEPTSGPIVLDDEVALQWKAQWATVSAKSLIDTRIVKVDAETTVEDACERMLSENVPCLCLTSGEDSEIFGLLDFADVNAFLTLAATRHTLSDNPRTEAIFAAARAGRVAASLVSNLSEKNPLKVLQYDATVVSLLTEFSKGQHRVLIQAEPIADSPYLGIISDRAFLTWFSTSDDAASDSFHSYLKHPLRNLEFRSIYLYEAVISASSKSTVLDAMRLMSEEGVGSVAVIDENTQALLSAVSVTDIGRIVVPSENKHILSIPLQQFITLSRKAYGETDGAESFPVYTVCATSSLLYTMQKLLATNSHRMFVMSEDSPTLTGIVSVVDILALFAGLVGVKGVDPAHMQRHRRASSVSSRSSRSESSTGSRRRSMNFP